VLEYHLEVRIVKNLNFNKINKSEQKKVNNLPQTVKKEEAKKSFLKINKQHVKFE